MRIVSKDSYLDKSVSIGDFCVIEEGVKIGKNCRIGHHVTIRKNTVIGDDVRIDDYTDIGKQPMKSLRSAISEGGTHPGTEIGNGTLIGTGVIIYAGVNIGRQCLIADQASVREEVVIGSMTIIGKGVSIENKVKIGSKVKLELGCYITALSVIEDYVFVAPMVTTTNDNFAGRNEIRKQYFKGVTIKKGGRIGGNSTILPGIVIGEDSFVGAGSVVTKDVPNRELWLGTPAKKHGMVPDDQLLENQKEGF